MNIENAKSQMRKGMLDYCVLLLLSRESCYANDIITRLKQAELIVVEGTLYPLLNRLKKDGLLSYEWRESTQGPPRKYYALTDAGTEFLHVTISFRRSKIPVRGLDARRLVVLIGFIDICPIDIDVIEAIVKRQRLLRPEGFCQNVTVRHDIGTVVPVYINVPQVALG